MGFFSNQHAEIVEMASEGARPLTISALTGIPLDTVYNVLEEYYAEQELVEDEY
jgi:hypothetical protein